MTLENLYNILKGIKEEIENQGRVKIAGTEKGTDNIPVVVVTYDGGYMGASPCSEVESVGLGFDWDAGKLMIFTKDKLYTGKTLRRN